MTDSYIQVRTDKKEKEQVNEILEKLGTNLSTVVNMLMKQIILTRSIPFDMKLEHFDEQEAATEEIRKIMDFFQPHDTIQLALEAKTERERIFYEMLGDYLLQVGQKMAIERNVY